MKQKEVIAKIAGAMFREYRKAGLEGMAALHNAVAELDQEFPGVLDEFELMLALI